jgi:hypothetical protein
MTYNMAGAFLNMVFFTTMFTTADVNIHALIAKYGIDIQIVRPEMTKFKIFREFSKHGFLFCGNYILVIQHTPYHGVSSVISKTLVLIIKPKMLAYSQGL